MSDVTDVLTVGAVIFCIALGSLIAFYFNDTMTDKFIQVPEINESAATVRVLQSSNAVSARLDYVVFGVFIALALGIIFSGFFVSGNSAYAIIYFLVLIVGTVLSMILSNVWETASTKPVFAASLSSFPLTNHLMTHLPTYFIVVGFIGVVVMFAKPSSDEER